MPDHLTKLARERSAASLRAVRAAVNEMDARGDTITVKAVARQAGVSRNFIYTTREAHDLVSKMRRGPGQAPQTRPTTSSSSEASLLSRLAAALATIDTLTEQVANLEARNDALLTEVIALQNPTAPSVTPIRRRRM